jgi:hypothetical protein
MTPHDFTEQNIQGLLKRAYNPEMPGPDFVNALTEKLCAKARDLAAERAAAPDAPVTVFRSSTIAHGPWWMGWAVVLGTAASVVAIVYYAATREPIDLSAHKEPHLRAQRPSPLPESVVQPPKPAPVAQNVLPRSGKVITGPGERRRITLEDGSVLFLNQDSMVEYIGPRQVRIEHGEVYVEAAPARKGKPPFCIKTPSRDVTALGTHFLVKAQAGGTGVLVTQGKVKLSDVAEKVQAGQQVHPGARKIEIAPRASMVLGWARELMARAESALVPASKYAGGALVAQGPAGQEIDLVLRRYHIDVHIEDGFARTTIDQTYFNQSYSRLEGTFFFPLPADASLSRLAMYVEEGGECRLMEGGMAERQHAREVYESILRARRDPALLEWVDGTTFKMRVFPLEGRKEKRIILSYMQRLASVEGVCRYRFPGGHSMRQVGKWSFAATIKNGAGLRTGSSFYSPGTMETSPVIEQKEQGRDLVLTSSMNNARPNWDVGLEIYGHETASDHARFATCTTSDGKYLMVAYRPDLPARARAEHRHWVILVEASGNRDPLLARAQINIVRYLLLNAEHEDTFTVLAANTRVVTFAARPATLENIEAAAKFLEGRRLLGALDLENALKSATRIMKQGRNTYLVHVGAGRASLGEHRPEVLKGILAADSRYIGIGVGKRWNRPLMKALAEHTGGHFTQINPDEPIPWRAFDLLATLNTPRLLDLRVVDAEEKASFLSDAALLAQGEELFAIARVDLSQNLPRQVIISGMLDGRPFVRKLPVRKPTENAGYLPRAWARLEIERLVGLGAERNKQRIIEVSKASYVMSPFTSLLVLENDADYARFNVDRGRKDHWAMYACPDRIPLVYEPNVSKDAVTSTGKGTVEDVLQSIIVHIPPPVLNRSGQATYFGAATAWQVYHWAFAEGSVGDWLLEDRKRTGAEHTMEWSSILGANILRNYFSENMIPSGFPSMPPGALPPVVMPYGMMGFGGNYPGNFQGGGGVLGNNLGGGIAGRIGGGASVPVPGMMGGMGQFGMQGGGPAFFYGTFQGGGNFQGGGLGFGGNLGGGFGGGFQRFGPGNSFAGNFQGGNFMGNTPGGGFAFQGGGLGFGSGPVQGSGGVPLISNGWMPGMPGAGWAPQVQGMPGPPGGAPGFPGSFSGPAGGPMAFHEGFLRHYSILHPRPWGRGLIYAKPAYTRESQIFPDLTAFAAGLQTSWSDLQAVLDSEASTVSRQGVIDPAARDLIEKARGSGWEAITWPSSSRHGALRLVCDGKGRHYLERTLPTGLREIVIGDGQTLWSLYPEIGLGARRPFSRFHQADFAEFVPWYLPSAELLARNADIKATGAYTVTILPHRQKESRVAGRQLVLVFGTDGGVRQRRIESLSDGSIVSREDYQPDGTVTVYVGGSSRPARVVKLTVAPAAAPNLRPDIKNLVIVPMPARTPEFIQRSYVLEQSGLERDLALFVSHCWSGNVSDALRVFGEKFHARGDRRLGFYVLLAGAGAKLSPNVQHSWNGTPVRFDMLGEHPSSPLAKYLFHFMDQSVPSMPREICLPDSSNQFLNELARFHDEWWRAGAEQSNRNIKAEEPGSIAKRFLSRARRTKVPYFAVAMLIAAEESAGRQPDLNRTLARRFLSLRDIPEFAYAARYEHARCLWAAGDRVQAARAFRELYLETLSQGVMPPIDRDFVRCAGEIWREGSPAVELLCKTPTHYLLLSWQLRSLGEDALAERLLTRAVDAATGREKVILSLAAALFTLQADHPERADRYFRNVVADQELAAEPRIWRWAAEAARRCHDRERAASLLERALALENERDADFVNLQDVRETHQFLLDHYRNLAGAVVILGDPGEKSRLLARIERAAEGWHAVEPANPILCRVAGMILLQLGERELAWQYLTTPLADNVNDRDAWRELARSLAAMDFELAQRASAEAQRQGTP